MKIKGDKMTKLNKVISTTKNLINLPHNQFNLNNHLQVYLKNEIKVALNAETSENLPIKLMSGNHPLAGILMTNWNRGNKRNIYIVGKGILFDSGGLNIKIRDMDSMTGDKAGMIIALSVANYLGGNVVAYCPVTTNFIQTSKIIPGDEIKIGNKLVKVNDTDAEGRLILAEAISSLYVSKNDVIITVATLTGCCEYAVDKATGVFGGLNLHPNSLVWDYLHAAEEAKELAWGLPMFDYMQDSYKKQPIKNYVKEIKAGASQGAMFLKQFVKYPENWIHLDIANSAFDKNGKANGVPIKSLINFIKKLQ
jgi:leucyl aminopeptidase